MRWWLVWTALICFGAWWDNSISAVRWRLHRPVRRLERTVHIKPIIFQNTSVLWINALTDQIDLTLIDVSHDAVGETDIEKLQMRVYNDLNRTDLAEIYEVDYNIFRDGVWNYSFLQNDIHLSPFRRLKVFPSVNWTLGTGTCAWCFPRRGYFHKGWWVEPKVWRWPPWAVAWAIGIAIIYKKQYNTYTGREIRFK